MQRYNASTALIVVDVQNDFADPSGQPVGRGRRRRSSRSINLEIAAGHSRPARSWLRPRTGTPSRRRISRRTAASGRSIAWPGRGAPSSTPTSSFPTMLRGPQGRQRRGRLFRLHDARPDDRRGDAHRARRPAPRTWHQACRRRRPRDRLLRQRHRARRRPARLRDGRADRRDRRGRPAAGRRRARARGDARRGRRHLVRRGCADRARAAPPRRRDLRAVPRPLRAAAAGPRPGRRRAVGRVGPVRPAALPPPRGGRDARRLRDRPRDRVVPQRPVPGLQVVGRDAARAAGPVPDRRGRHRGARDRPLADGRVRGRRRDRRCGAFGSRRTRVSRRSSSARPTRTWPSSSATSGSCCGTAAAG